MAGKHWKDCECRKCERGRIEKLQAENERLREALSYIRDFPWSASNVQAVARQALWHKEGGG